jgi:hypothetical protein
VVVVVWGYSKARSIVMEANGLETREGVCEDSYPWVVLESGEGSVNCH